MKLEFIPVLCICLISIIVSILCLALYIFKRKQIDKDLSTFLLVNQMLDLLLCTNTLINPNYSEGTLCTFQGFCDQFTSFLLIEWDIIIVFKIYYQIFNRRFPLSITSALSVGVSFIIAIIPVPLKYYKVNYIYCTFDNKSHLILYFCYIPLWVSAVVIFIILNRVEKISKKRLSNKKNRNEFIFALKLFPISLIFCYMFLSVSRIVEIFIDSNSLKAYFIFSLCFSRIHGTINGVITFKSYWKSEKLKKIESSSEIENFSQLIREDSMNIKKK